MVGKVSFLSNYYFPRVFRQKKPDKLKYKQTNGKANKQTISCKLKKARIDNQAEKQINKQTYKQTDKNINKQTNKLVIIQKALWVFVASV